jgi:hypothetical protein
MKQYLYPSSSLAASNNNLSAFQDADIQVGFLLPTNRTIISYKSEQAVKIINTSSSESQKKELNDD